MLQDHRGFVWIGTEYGLNRYDGHQFTVFKDDPENEGSLTGSSILSIFEDNEHMLWVGTDLGLNRLNPKIGKFELIKINRKADTKEIINVRKITQDVRGDIWLATERNGLKRLYQEEKSSSDTWQVEHFFHDPNNPHSIPSNEVKNVLPYNDNFVWVTTANSTCRLDTRKGEFEVFIDLHSNRNRHIASDDNGILLLDENKNIVKFNENLDLIRIHRPTSVPLDFEYSIIAKGDNFISDKGIFSAYNKKDDFWIATFGGLYHFNETSGKIFNYKHDPQSSNPINDNRLSVLMFDNRQNLWIGKFGIGINVLEAKKNPFQHYSHKIGNPNTLLSNQVRSMVIDEAGFLWVATLYGGLNKMAFDSIRGWIKVESWTKDNSYPKPIPLKTIIKLIKTENGKIWLGANPRGLIELDPVTHTMTAHYGEDNNIFNFSGIWALCEDQERHLWIGTYKNGLYRFDPTTQDIRSYDMDPDNEAHEFITNIYEDSKANVWICTANGLFRYDARSQLFDKFVHDPNDLNSISHSWVWSITEDSHNRLWLGTNNGLNIYNPDTGIFERFYEKDGLPANIVTSIVEDEKGYIWVGTVSGLARYLYNDTLTYHDKTQESFRRYTAEEGLFGETFLAHSNYKDKSSGQLYFGGLHGFNVIDPTILKIDSTPSIMVLSSCSFSAQNIDNGKINTDHFISSVETTSLSYQNDFLQFTFSDLAYHQGSNNNFEYKLQGLSERWISLEEDFIMTFIDLAPGDYALIIKGVTPDGILIEEKKMINISISPPWWKSWWAYSFYFISITGMFFIAYRFQLSRQIEKREGQRLKELDHVKSRLYTNITHEFRTPLTVISGVAEQMKGDNLEHNKTIIKRNSDQLLNLVNQMLDLRKLESGEVSIQKTQGDIVKFIRYLTESLKSYAELKGLTIHFLSEEQCLIMDFDKEKMTRIHSNLLSNAIKFTPEGGNIYVHLDIEKIGNYRLFTMKIRDSGVGISKDNLLHIFDRFYQVDDSSTRKGEGTGIGLTLVSELIKAMDGEVKVKSIVGEGTTFSITLPITNISELVDDTPDSNPSNMTMMDTTIPAPSDLTAISETGIEDPSKPIALIVEDNADVIHYLINCLKDIYAIEIAMNGEEGIFKAIENIPDIIVSDVMMPIKDGFELCQTLKNDERTSHIPIILLTAKANIESRLEGLQRGADAYLSKPFHQEELLIILKSQLELRIKLQKRFSRIDSPSHLESEEYAETIVLETEDTFLKKIRDIIEKDLSDAHIGMPQLVRKIGMSRSQIFKKVKALTGNSPSIYIRSIRLHHAQMLLKTTDFNVSEIAYEVGFSTPSYFSDVFFEEFGFRPSETRK